jgi:hypothetical protein
METKAEFRLNQITESFTMQRFLDECKTAIINGIEEASRRNLDTYFDKNLLHDSHLPKSKQQHTRYTLLSYFEACGRLTIY